MSEQEKSKVNLLELEKWLEDYGPRLFLFARQQTENYADAQDVYQEAIIKVIRDALRTGKDDVPVTGRVFLAIKHTAIDMHRQRRSRSKRELDYDANTSVSSWFNPPFEKVEQYNQLQDAIKLLPPEQQEVLILKIWGEQTFKAIADILGISINTVTSRYRYGINQIRSSLELQAI